MSANWETSAVATGLEKASCLSNPKEGSAKEHSNYWTTVLILHASKGMLIILQARFQQYVNFLMYKLGLEKAEEPEIKLLTFTGS